MPDSKNSSTASNNETVQLSSGEITPWWKIWQKNQEWRDQLAKKASFKALDIPDDDMHITDAKTINNGLSTIGAIGLAAASGGIPTAAMLGMTLFNSLASNSNKEISTTKETNSTVQQVGPSDGAEIQFYVRDENGELKPINLPRLEK